MPVINKKLTLQRGLKISVQGDANIKLYESNFNEIEISHDELGNDVLCNIEDDSILISNKKKFGHAPEIPGNQGILFAILSAINKIQIDAHSRKKIDIKLGLNRDSALDLIINCDNLNMEIISVKVGKLFINSANLALSIDDIFSSALTKINSSNIKGNFLYSKLNKNIAIEANNGKLLIRKNSDYGGAMNFSGNNLKINGSNVTGDPSIGLLKIKMNNGKVHLVQQQETVER